MRAISSLHVMVSPGMPKAAARATKSGLSDGIGLAVATVEEQLLPLAHHAEALVVQQHHLHLGWARRMVPSSCTFIMKEPSRSPAPPRHPGRDILAPMAAAGRSPMVPRPALEDGCAGW